MARLVRKGSSRTWPTGGGGVPGDGKRGKFLRCAPLRHGRSRTALRRLKAASGTVLRALSLSHCYFEAVPWLKGAVQERPKSTAARDSSQTFRESA